MVLEEPQHERFGLLQLYPDGKSDHVDTKPRKLPPLDTEFDIFAVHGLNGNREETWTYDLAGYDAGGGKKPKSRHGSYDLGKGDTSMAKTHAAQNPLWLRDFLRHDFPNARIYSIGYNSKVAGSYGTGGLDSFALEILINDKKRPIIFVCHSMGGLVVKKALVAQDAKVRYKNIIESTSAVLFFGTPHGGSDYAAITKSIANIAHVTLPKHFGTFRKDLIGSLERNGPELLELSRNFRYLVHEENITVYSFLEQDRHRLLSSRIVDGASATLGDVTEDIIPLNGHHTQITRFPSEESNNYAIVLTKLRQHVSSLNYRDRISHDRDRAEISSSSSMPVFLGVGKVSEHFVGRDNIMERLDALLNVNGLNQARAALVGLGGAGKTEIAIAYAHQHKAKHPQHSVFWIHAASADRMRQDFIAVTDSLNLRGYNKPGLDRFELLREWLQDSKNGSWLIILDNLDDLKTLSDLGKSSCSCHPGEYSFLDHYLPQVPHGSVLATTRTKQVGKRLVRRQSQLIEIGFMSKNEALGLLRESELQGAEEVLCELAMQLECLPLAIIQAAAFITSNDMPVERFITHLREGDEQLTKILSRDPEYELDGSGPTSSVAATWKISFDQILKQNSQAADLLAIMIFFDRQKIPVEWLRRSTETKSEQNQIDFEGQLGVLKAFSLVSERSDTSGTLEMHRLVQLMTRNWLVERGDADSKALEALGIISHHFPSGDQGTWSECAENLSHALNILKDSLTSKSSLARESQQHRFELRSRIIRYLISQTLYVEAEDHTKRILEEMKASHDKFDEEYIQVEIEHCNILKKLGSYGNAEKLAREVMKNSTKSLGKDHALTWKAAECLLHILGEQARFIEAIKLTKTSLEKRKKQLGESHPDVLVWLDGLSALLYLYGNYQEAEEYLRQSIQWRNVDPSRGPVDLVTLKLNVRLGRVLSAQGRFREAETHFEKVIHDMDGSLGVEHHERFIAIFHKAQNLQQSRHYEQAEPLFRKLLEKCSHYLGSNHPQTWIVMLAIADVLQGIAQQTNPPSTACLEKARELNERVLEFRSEHYPKNHPEITSAMSSLATYERLSGKLADADKRETEAWESAKASLGTDHPVALQSASNRAMIYQSQSNLKAAAEWHKRALEGRQKKLQWHHPDTWFSADRLAEVLDQLGKKSDAKKLRKQMAAHLSERPEGLDNAQRPPSHNEDASFESEQGNLAEKEYLSDGAELSKYTGRAMILVGALYLLWCSLLCNYWGVGKSFSPVGDKRS